MDEIMKTIWKFPLQLSDAFDIVMPAGAEILHVANQHGGPVLWALVDPDAGQVVNHFGVFGTGCQLDWDLSWEFIGTCLNNRENIVTHVFRIPSE